MLRSRNFARFLTIAVLLMALTAVSMVHAQDKKILVTGINMTNGDPEGIDPGLSQDSKQIQILDELYVGLTRLDEVSLEVRPGLAESWTVSDDGKVFTFKLRKEIPWVRYNADTDAVEELKDDAGNVRYVTANDLVYAWKRNFDPATASPYVYVLAPYVTGGADFKGPDSELGVKAVDDYTVEITSPVVAGSFVLNIYGMWFSRPLLQSVIDEGGTSWTEPENTATYGPFALKEWKHDESLTLIKNPFWPDTEAVPQPKIDEVVLKFLDDTTQLPEYEAGTMSGIEVPADQIDRIKADATLSKEYSNGVQNTTYYYGFNVTKPPFDNVHIRRAFSYAIDRQSIVDNITKAGEIPARWYTHPANVGAPSLEKNPTFGVGYDPDQAKAELALGLKDLGLTSVDGLPSITLAFGNTPRHNAVAQAVQQMWQDNLGIKVELAAMDTTTYFSVQREDANQIFRSGWNADYPDANNWLNETMHTGVAQNYGKFSNPEFDKLVEEAASLLDNDKRAELYAKAEDILVKEDAAIAPLYWYVTKQLTKPNVERTHSIIGTEFYEKWDIKQ